MTKQASFVPSRALAVTPHADDVTLFAGGTLIEWIDAGCRVAVVRVTQDEKDSFEHPIAEIIARNHEEFLVAMALLGVSTTMHLGYRDCELMDVRYGELRERLIRAIRSFRPDIIVSFDPAYTEDENPDHRVVATAVADAAWASAYPAFHPEHRRSGLEPHRVLGCYYFTREFVRGQTVVDIEPVIDRKIRAVVAHRTMMRTMLQDHKERMARAGLSAPGLEAVSADDSAAYWDGLIRAAAALAGAPVGLGAAERFRSTVPCENDPLVRYLMSL
jgi:LmbE family N-acetylglucosaminyl deacetylase